MVQLEEVTVVFHGGRAGGHRALDGVSLEIAEGDFFALLGPNGAGKSTAVYCLLGLLRPTSGRAAVFGQPLEPGAAAFRDITFVPEEPHYHDYLTVEEAVTYYATLHGDRPSRQKLTDVLGRLRLDDARTTRLADCSKGMKQKVGFALCLVTHPRLMVLDEPMRGLDPLTVKELRDVLLDLNRHGVTIVMNSHLLSEVEQIATRAAILANGRLLTASRLDELVGEQRDVYVVEVEHFESTPDYFNAGVLSDGRQRGEVPAARLFDFMEAARARGAVIRHCSLKKRTLEQSFIEVLAAEGDGHA
jgi:ABC-2 type transport system ATP-binding protein